MDERHREVDIDLVCTVTDEPGNGEGQRLVGDLRGNGVVDALDLICHDYHAHDVHEVRALVQEVDVPDHAGPHFMGVQIALI